MGLHKLAEYRASGRDHIHAKSTFSRIALLIKQTGVGQTLDYDVIMKTLYTTIDVVVYMEHRQIVEVLYDPAFKKAQLSL